MKKSTSLATSIEPSQVPDSQVDWAFSITHAVPGIYLWNSVQSCLRTKIATSHWEEYLHATVREAAVTSDPLERMMIEQITLAYHNIARLHMQASNAETLEHAEVYNSAAARLLGEFRRTVLALREYRAPIASKQVTLVQQQNLASGNQQVAFVESGVTLPGSADKNCDAEEKSTKTLEAIAYEPYTIFNPQSQNGRGRQAEPVEARTVDSGRAGTTKAVCLEEQAVAESHRTENPSRQEKIKAAQQAASEGVYPYSSDLR